MKNLIKVLRNWSTEKKLREGGGDGEAFLAKIRFCEYLSLDLRYNLQPGVRRLRERDDARRELARRRQAGRVLPEGEPYRAPPHVRRSGADVVVAGARSAGASGADPAHD